MKKNNILKLLNLLLFISMLFQAVLIFGHDLFTRDVFMPTHMWNGRVLIILAIIHLILNWSWVTANFLPKKK